MVDYLSKQLPSTRGIHVIQHLLTEEVDFVRWCLLSTSYNELLAHSCGRVGLCAPLFHEHACLGFLLAFSFGALVSFMFPSCNCGLVFRQKQMLLKKRQWHETHGSQQPDWGIQLCESSEHLGKVGCGVTLVGGEGFFGATGTTFGFWIGREDRKRKRGVTCVRGIKLNFTALTLHYVFFSFGFVYWEIQTCHLLYWFQKA